MTRVRHGAPVVAWLPPKFTRKRYPGSRETDRTSGFTVYDYSLAQNLVQVLEQCGDDLTHENVMKQAANMRDLELPMLLPGIKIHTSPTDYFSIEQMQMMRFIGKNWDLFGPVISGEVGS